VLRRKRIARPAPGRLATLVTLPGLVAGAPGPSPSPSPPPPPVTIAWQAPPECPDAEAFLAAVRERTETSAVVDGNPTADVRCSVRRADRDYEGTKDPRNRRPGVPDDDGWASFEVEAGAGLPLVRDSFVFEPRVVSYQAPAGFLWTGAGASARFR